MKDAIIIALMLAVVLLSLGQSRDPQPAIQDTTQPSNFHRAQQPAPDDARPVLQRCYPVAPQSDQPFAAIGAEQEPIT